MKQRGFSLLELLVAFAIMAMSLGLIYRVAGGSARNTADASQAQQAAWLAESLLAGHRYLEPSGWNEDGQSAGMDWQVRSTPYPGVGNGSVVFALQEVQVSIQWAGGARPGQLMIHTLRPVRALRPGEVAR
jgi:general secretion pathway protein I